MRTPPPLSIGTSPNASISDGIFPGCTLHPKNAPSLTVAPPCPCPAPPLPKFFFFCPAPTQKKRCPVHPWYLFFFYQKHPFFCNLHNIRNSVDLKHLTTKHVCLYIDLSLKGLSELTMLGSQYWQVCLKTNGLNIGKWWGASRRAEEKYTTDGYKSISIDDKSY